MNHTLEPTHMEDTFIDFSFPAALYFELKSISTIPFTPREVDILACIQGGRSTKAIAALLLISPRTVENHTRNIMLKIRCSSQENIIDFLEKSDKFILIQKYYSALAIQFIFEKELKKIFSQLKEKIPSCMLIYNKVSAEECLVIQQLEKHLKTLGVQIKIDCISNYNTTSVHHVGIFNDVDHVIISCLSNDSKDYLNISQKTEVPRYLYLAQLAKQEDKSILFLYSKNNSSYNPTSGDNFIALEQQNNYYLFIFAIARKLLPKFDFENHISDFTKQHERLIESKKIQPLFPYKNNTNTQPNLYSASTNLATSEDQSNFTTDYHEKIFSRQKLLYCVGICCVFLLSYFLLFHTFQKKDVFSNKSLRLPQDKLKNSIYATPNNTLTDWNLPRQDNKFVGRKDLLDRVSAYFDSFTDTHGTSKTIVTVLTGLGGVGKTQLALQYLYHPPISYNFKIWLCAENKEQLKRRMIELAKYLGFLKEDVSFRGNVTSEMAADYVKQWLSRNPGWLLVFDNVQDYNEIMTLLPEEGGHIVITTRNRQWPSNFNILPVSVMEEEEAVNLVTGLVQRNVNSEEEFFIKKIVKTLGFLPLALAQAGTFMQNKAISAKNYLALYEQYGDNILKNNSTPEGTNHVPTAITWNVSIEAIEKEMEIKKHPPIARHLLTVCAFLNSKDIPRTTLLEWLKMAHPEIQQPELALMNSLDILSKYSLIDLSQDSVSMHRLVQTVLRQQYLSNSNFLNRKFASAGINWYVKLFEVLDAELWNENQLNQHDKMQQLLPHLQSLSEHCKEMQIEPEHIIMGYILCDIGWILQYYFFDLSQAKSYFEQSLAILEEHASDEKERMSRILNTLGIIYRESAQYNKAIEFIEKSLKIKRKLYGEDHIEVAISLNSLGIAYMNIGELELSKQTLTQSLRIKEKIKGMEHISIANTLTNLAIVHYTQKNLSSARQLLEKALSIQSRVFPNFDDIYIGKTLTYLGAIQLELGNAETAKSLLERALTIREKYCGKDHINVAVTLDNLAKTYSALGNMQQSKTISARATLIKKSHSNSLEKFN